MCGCFNSKLVNVKVAFTCSFTFFLKAKWFLQRENNSKVTNILSSIIYRQYFCIFVSKFTYSLQIIIYINIYKVWQVFVIMQPWGNFWAMSLYCGALIKFMKHAKFKTPWGEKNKINPYLITVIEFRNYC